jgi:antitoxin component of MazEF toxin-antitoxin module
MRMTKKLTRTGGSDALVISRDMKAHLGLIDGTVEVEFREGGILLTRPEPRKISEDLKQVADRAPESDTSKPARR